MDFQLTPPAANWEASLFPAQFTNDKIAPLLTQRQALFRGHDPGGFGSVYNTQVDNWHTRHWQSRTSSLTQVTQLELIILPAVVEYEPLHRMRLKIKVARDVSHFTHR